MYRYCCPIQKNVEFSRQIFEEFTIIRFH